MVINTCLYKYIHNNNIIYILFSSLVQITFFFKLTQKLSVHCQGGKPDTGKFHSSYIGMNVCGSAYENGCMVDGTCATAAD